MDRPALSSLLRGCFIEADGPSVQYQEQEVDASSSCSLAPGIVRCRDEKDAAHRLLSAFQLTPGYHSLVWNLDQFGRYIVRVNQGREGVRGFRTELLALLGEWLATALEWATLAWPYAVFTPGANPYYTPALPSLLTHYASIAAQRGMWGRRAVAPPPPPAPVMYGLPDAPPPIPPPPLLLRHIGPAYGQVIPMRSVAASISALSAPLSAPYQVRVPLNLCARSGPLSYFVQNLYGFPHPSVALAMTITRCHHLYCSAPGLLLRGVGAGVEGGKEREEVVGEVQERKGGKGKGKFGVTSPLHPLLNVHTALEPWRRRPRLWYDGEELIEEDASPNSSPNTSPPKGGVGNPPFSPPPTTTTIKSPPPPPSFPSTPNNFSPSPLPTHPQAAFRSPHSAPPPPPPQGFSNPSPIDEGVDSNPFTLSPPSSRPSSMRITSPLAVSGGGGGGGGGSPPTPNTSALAWDILNGTRQWPHPAPHSTKEKGEVVEEEEEELVAVEACDLRFLMVPQMGLPHQATDVLREHLETRLFTIPGLSALVFHRPGMERDWGAAWWEGAQRGGSGVRVKSEGGGGGGGKEEEEGEEEIEVGGSGIEGILPPPTVRHALVTALAGAHLQRACSITSTPTPAGKIGELVEASQVLDRALRVWGAGYGRGGGGGGGGEEGPTTGADDLLPAMIWTLLVAPPCGILETLGALEEVGREFGAGGGGQGQYVVTNWRIAVEFLRREGGRKGGKGGKGKGSTKEGKTGGGDGGAQSMHAMAALV